MNAVTVVVASRNRAPELCRTLAVLTALPERPPVILVDNASDDGTVGEVRRRFPSVRLLTLPANVASAARTVGARLAATPYVAFSDDDSWWEPGALHRAAKLLDAYPRLGVLAARTLVGPSAKLDPLSAEMARSPLCPGPELAGLPGVPVLGFLACASVVRKEAFLAVGGFSRLLFIYGEEELVAYDLAAAGWHIAYVPEVVAHHHPSAVRDNMGRRAMQRRNGVLVDWLRRPVRRAAGSTCRLAADAVHDPAARMALRSAMLRLPVALAQRRRLPPAIERAALTVEASGGPG